MFLQQLLFYPIKTKCWNSNTKFISQRFSQAFYQIFPFIILNPTPSNKSAVCLSCHNRVSEDTLTPCHPLVVLEKYIGVGILQYVMNNTEIVKK